MRCLWQCRPGIDLSQEPPAVRMNDELGGILTFKLKVVFQSCTMLPCCCCCCCCCLADAAVVVFVVAAVATWTCAAVAVVAIAVAAAAAVTKLAYKHM